MYQYPSDEATTDALEARQDPYKRLREIAIIQAMVGFRWNAAMDFGCGKGRNLPLLHRAQVEVEKSSLMAVDADAERLVEAKQSTQHLRSSSFTIDYIAAGAEDLGRVAPPSSLDLILCCQVLGHMSVAACASAMTSFARLLKPNGALILCVPFHNLPTVDDYFHEVDLSRPNPTTVERRKLSQSQFDRLTQSGEQHRLPVRAFHAGDVVGIGGNVELPFCIAPPNAFREHDTLRASSCFAYSVHEYSAGQAIIGDLALKLIRSAQ